MKRLLPFLLGLVLSLPAVAQYIDGDFKFTVQNGEARIQGHIQDTATLATHVHFPNTVTANGVTYPVVAVGGFKGYAKLPGISLPAGLRTLSPEAFAGCTALSGTLTLPATLDTIGTSAFLNCSGLTGSLRIPDSVRQMGNSAFAGCTGFTGTLTLSSGLTRLENNVFRNCSGFTGELTIPNGVTSIGSMAFNNGAGFDGQLTLPEGLKTIGASAFSSCRKLTGDLCLPAAMESIGMSAFSNCSSLDGTLTLPATLTTLGASAFRNCVNLKGELTIPQGLTAIHEETFWACESLTGGITVPEGVVSIARDAFRNNPGLNGPLSLPSTLQSIGLRAFFNNPNMTGPLTIPANVTTIGTQAFERCSGFTGTLTLSPELTGIEARTFWGCTGLTGDLVIPEGVGTIGEAAFSTCSSFTSLALPSTLDTIGVSAFYQCSWLTGDLIIPKSVKEMGRLSFSGCERLTGFTVEAGSALTSLASAIWRQCASLEYIDLTPISANALNGYGDGAGAYFGRTANAGMPFYGTPSHTVVYLPTGADASRITQSDSTANYVLEGQCQWLSVQDAYDYELPHPFMALKATYNNKNTQDYRTFSGPTAKTVYLPYPATVPTGMRAYRLSKRHKHVNDAYEYYFVFSSLAEGEKMAANTPHLLLVTDGQVKQFGVDTNVEVPAMPTPEESAQGDAEGQWLFCGTTEKIANADAAAQGAYNLKNNVWHPISTNQPSGYVNHFRCFIKPAPGNTNPTKSFAIYLMDSEEGDTETAIGETNAALSQGTARIYTIQGTCLGTDFDSLPEGLYIVDGKKVYKM